MRIVSWNIEHGGGKRAGRIKDQLALWNPDIVGLQEFRGTSPSGAIAAFLKEQGLVHQFDTTDETCRYRNRLLLASRWPLRIQVTNGLLAESGRWINARVEAPIPLRVTLLCVPSRSLGRKCKYAFHDAVVETLATMSARSAVALGDTNTGRRGIDEEASFFNIREDEWFARLSDAGWTDIWRKRNPEERQYTWCAPNSGNGFRLDQAFVTASMEDRVRTVSYDWGEDADSKHRSPSDHAAILLDIDQ